MSYSFKVGDLVKCYGQSGVIVEFKNIGGNRHVVVQCSDSHDKTVPYSALEKADSNPLEKVKQGFFTQYPDDFYYRLTAKRLELRNKFEPYTFLANSRLMLQPHQVFVAHKVTQKMHPRYILADEVGLGKTIEAGMVIKELKARGYAKRVLIIAPANLVTQWQREMDTKFNEHFTIYNRDTLKFLNDEYPGQDPWQVKDNILVSMQFARRAGIAKSLYQLEWDLVIFDEAHHLRSQLDKSSNVSTNLAYQLGRELTAKTRSMLLLTATPMQLHDYEFYSLTKLVDPVLFQSYDSFQSHRHSKIPEMNDTFDKLLKYDQLSLESKNELAKKLCELLELPVDTQVVKFKMTKPVERHKYSQQLMAAHPLSKIMIRNRKKSVGGFAERRAHTVDVNLNPAEQALYDEVSEYITTGYRTAVANNKPVVGFLLVIFQKLLTSSTYALRKSLERRLERISGSMSEVAASFDLESYYEEDVDINQVWEQILQDAGSSPQEILKLRSMISKAKAIKRDSKLQELLKLVKEILNEPNEKILIFTQFRDTLDYLLRHLRPLGSVVAFHGGMSAVEKDQATERFRTTAQIMISTDAGGEGRNFQFCHNLVNYDLPWNPMKIEQRIGRVDRFGQKYNINVFNFSIAGTIEDRVYRVLNERIKIFEETIGGLEPILGNVEKNIEELVVRFKNDKQDFAKFEKDLETDVFRARQMEDMLRDFIMDISSFESEKANAILLQNTRDFYAEIEKLTLDFLKRFTTSIEATRPGIYKIEVPSIFREHCRDIIRQENLPPLREVYNAAFDPEIASENENTCSFIAFGHELLESIVKYCTKRLPDNAATYYVKRSNSSNLRPQRGLLVNYLVHFCGVEERSTIIPVFVDSSGKASIETGLELYVLKPEVSGQPLIDNLNIPELYSRSEAVLVPFIQKNLQGYQEDNERKVKEERLRIEKFTEYQIGLVREKINSLQARIQDLLATGTKEQQRILPVWRQQIQNHDRELKRWSDYRQKQLQRLADSSHAGYEFSPYSVAIVEII